MKSKYAFGTIGWQNDMMNNVSKKMLNRQKLNPFEKTFLKIQLEHNRRLVDRLDKFV